MDNETYFYDKFRKFAYPPKFSCGFLKKTFQTFDVGSNCSYCDCNKTQPSYFSIPVYQIQGKETALLTPCDLENILSSAFHLKNIDLNGWELQLVKKNDNENKIIFDSFNSLKSKKPRIHTHNFKIHTEYFEIKPTVKFGCPFSDVIRPKQSRPRCTQTIIKTCASKYSTTYDLPMKRNSCKSHESSEKFIASSNLEVKSDCSNLKKENLPKIIKEQSSSKKFSKDLIWEQKSEDRKGSMSKDILILEQESKSIQKSVEIDLTKNEILEVTVDNPEKNEIEAEERQDESKCGNCNCEEKIIDFEEKCCRSKKSKKCEEKCRKKKKCLKTGKKKKCCFCKKHESDTDTDTERSEKCCQTQKSGCKKNKQLDTYTSKRKKIFEPMNFCYEMCECKNKGTQVRKDEIRFFGTNYYESTKSKKAYENSDQSDTSDDGFPIENYKCTSKPEIDKIINKNLKTVFKNGRPPSNESMENWEQKIGYQKIEVESRRLLKPRQHQPIEEKISFLKNNLDTMEVESHRTIIFEGIQKKDCKCQFYDIYEKPEKETSCRIEKKGSCCISTCSSAKNSPILESNISSLINIFTDLGPKKSPSKMENGKIAPTPPPVDFFDCSCDVFHF